MKTNRILYLECYSGISGDMTVGALLHLGADEKKLRTELAKLPLSGYEMKISDRKVHGLTGLDFDVVLTEEFKREEQKEADGEKGRSHEHRHGHSHRHYGEIKAMLESSELEEEVKSLALRIFEITAKAESRVHGVPEEEVAFHEVGAVDSIVDIVAASVCIWDLGIERTAVSELWEGRGTVNCQHGRIPVPVPAVTEILKDSGLPVRLTETEGEMVTPTGAAIAAALCNTLLPQKAVIRRIGVGTGKKEFEHPNMLRAMLLEECGN